MLAAAIFGCGSREKQLVGKWTGDLKIPDSKKDDPMVKMAQGMMGALSLELKDDKTFVMSMMVPFEGTWTVSGDKLSLQVTKMMGMTVEQAKSAARTQGQTKDLDQMDKPMEFSISADGKELTAIKKEGAPGADQGDLIFKKSG